VHADLSLAIAVTIFARALFLHLRVQKKLRQRGTRNRQPAVIEYHIPFVLQLSPLGYVAREIGNRGNEDEKNDEKSDSQDHPISADSARYPVPAFISG